MRSLAATLYRGSAVFLAIYVAGSAISFGVHLFMARVLGATSYGYFVYATSWMAILLLGCNIGLKPTVVRFVAAYSARGEWGLLRGLLRSSTSWTIGAVHRHRDAVGIRALASAPARGRARSDASADWRWQCLSWRSATSGARRFAASGPSRVHRFLRRSCSTCWPESRCWRSSPWRNERWGRLRRRRIPARNHRRARRRGVVPAERSFPGKFTDIAAASPAGVGSCCREQRVDLVLPGRPRAIDRRHRRCVCRLAAPCFLWCRTTSRQRRVAGPPRDLGIRIAADLAILRACRISPGCSVSPSSLRAARLAVRW